ncbi:MAG: hypothetical protein KDC38_12570 [Planctomycetes bacterium]|nr:hypothetical protein [Planctomycetota bacterium]
MKVALLLGLWLAVMLSIIWGTHFASHDAPTTHESDESSALLEGISFSPPLAPTKNNREEVLREAGVFPCSQCHNLLITNPRKRADFAPPHDGIVVDHGEATSCLTCHSDSDRDHLVLVDGTPVGFNESYRVWGGCHGPIYRDWRHGAHGQRTGHWNGDEQHVWVCVRCHHPHRPAFAPMTPLPPPPVPRGMVEPGGHTERGDR